MRLADDEDDSLQLRKCRRVETAAATAEFRRVGGDGLAKMSLLVFGSPAPEHNREPPQQARPTAERRVSPSTAEQERGTSKTAVSPATNASFPACLSETPPRQMLQEGTSHLSTPSTVAKKVFSVESLKSSSSSSASLSPPHDSSSATHGSAGPSSQCRQPIPIKSSAVEKSGAEKNLEKSGKQPVKQMKLSDFFSRK